VDHERATDAYKAVPDLESVILEALRAAGKDVDALAPEDLSPVDEFHIRGRRATQELAALAEVQEGWRVLDVGSGLGGSARLLALEFGCHVTGLDAQPTYCEAAASLSRRLGLSHLTQFDCGDACALPYTDGAFDLVWTEHTQMTVADKTRFCAEIARVLRPGGRLAFHDIFQGPGGGVHFPVPWATVAAGSHLVTPDELRKLLEAGGFEVRHWRDVSAESLAAFEHAVARTAERGPSPLGTHLLSFADALTLQENQRRNLAECRIVVFEAAFDAPPR